MPDNEIAENTESLSFAEKRLNHKLAESDVFAHEKITKFPDQNLGIDEDVNLTK